MFNNIRKTIRAIKNIWPSKKIEALTPSKTRPPSLQRIMPKQFDRLAWAFEEEQNPKRKEAIYEFAKDLKDYYKGVFIEAIHASNAGSYFGLLKQSGDFPGSDLSHKEWMILKDKVEIMWESDAELEDALTELTYNQIFKVREILLGLEKGETSSLDVLMASTSTKKQIAIWDKNEAPELQEISSVQDTSMFNILGWEEAKKGEFETQMSYEKAPTLDEQALHELDRIGLKHNRADEGEENNE